MDLAGYIIGGLATVAYGLSMRTLKKVDDNQIRLFELITGPSNDPSKGLEHRVTRLETEHNLNHRRLTP